MGLPGADARRPADAGHGADWEQSRRYHHGRHAATGTAKYEPVILSMRCGQANACLLTFLLVQSQPGFTSCCCCAVSNRPCIAVSVAAFVVPEQSTLHCPVCLPHEAHLSMCSWDGGHATELG